MQKFPFHYMLFSRMMNVCGAECLFHLVKYFHNAEQKERRASFSLFCASLFHFNYVSSARTQLDIATAKQSI